MPIEPCCWALPFLFVDSSRRSLPSRSELYLVGDNRLVVDEETGCSIRMFTGRTPLPASPACRSLPARGSCRCCRNRSSHPAPAAPCSRITSVNSCTASMSPTLPASPPPPVSADPPTANATADERDPALSRTPRAIVSGIARPAAVRLESGPTLASDCGRRSATGWSTLSVAAARLGTRLALPPPARPLSFQSRLATGWWRCLLFGRTARGVSLRVVRPRWWFPVPRW